MVGGGFIDKVRLRGVFFIANLANRFQKKHAAFLGERETVN